ncbi:MAG: oxidoreductase, partial [Ignavibacteria bacterium]|nr:oxidoreductase [Ignavibacteria bacterium]
SYEITALILFLILTPVNSIDSAVIFLIAGVISMGSKYLLVINKKHIFNPAAFSLVLIGLMGSGQAEWWVGNRFMFPLVLIVGLLIVRKTRRFHLLISFLIVSITTTLLFAALNKTSPLTILPLIVTSYPLLFLGTVMLTEPITLPPSKKLQMIYGTIVGVLSGVQFNYGIIFATPELALVIGNIFSYSVSFRRRLILTLKEKVQISSNIYEFIFSSNSKFPYIPGQYMEWTLGHKNPDSRGIRRYFTLASSPAEDVIRVGIRIDPEHSSSFKKTLLDLKKGEKIYAGQLAGDFVLPKDAHEKYVFIAGGIGITPFRSMIKNMIDKNIKHDVTLFYICSEFGEFAFSDIFDQASNVGVKTIFVCSKPNANWKGRSGRIDAKMLKEDVPDYQNSTYYLSGPNAMVNAYKDVLSSVGIRPHRIVTDYF